MLLDMVLGLDYDETNNLLLMGSANAFDPEVYFYDPEDGTYHSEIAYTSPQTNFGVCINDDGSIVYFTEWFQGKLYAYDCLVGPLQIVRRVLKAEVWISEKVIFG